MENKRICPLLSERSGYPEIFCKQSKCAWWDNRMEQCSIKSIVDTMDNIATK